MPSFDLEVSMLRLDIESIPAELTLNAMATVRVACEDETVLQSTIIERCTKAQFYVTMPAAAGPMLMPNPLHSVPLRNSKIQPTRHSVPNEPEHIKHIALSRRIRSHEHSQRSQFKVKLADGAIVLRPDTSDAKTAIEESALICGHSCTIAA